MTRTDLNSEKRRRKTNNPTAKLGTFQRPWVETFQRQLTGSWNELHQVMANNGLELKERGNGFVVEAQDGTQVKASSIDRAFSKSKLEERFGSFEPSPFQFHQVDEAWLPE